MGNAYCRRGEPFIPGLVLDQVVAGTSPDSKCILYSLANFRKGGILIESFNKGGSKGVMVLILSLKVECIPTKMYSSVQRWKMSSKTKLVS